MAASWRNVHVMCGTILFTLTGVFSWYRVLGNHLRDLGADELQVGWAFVALAFAHRLPQYVGGIIADRFGRKGLIVGVGLTMAVCYIAMGLAATWWTLAIATGLCWIAGAAQWPAILAIVTEGVPDHQRGRAIGRLEMFGVAGWAFGPLVGEHVEKAYPQSAWLILLLLTAGIYFVCAAVRAGLLRETHGAAARTDGGSVDWHGLALPAAIAILAAMIAFWTVDGPILSLYMEDELGRGRAGIDRIFFYAGLAALAAAPVAGWLTDRAGAARTLRLAFVLFAAILAPFAVALARGTPLHRMAPGLDLALFVALMVPLECFQVAFQRFMTAAAPAERRARTVGAFGIFTGVFSPWAYLAAAWFYRDVSRTLPLAAAGALALVCLVLSFRLK